MRLSQLRESAPRVSGWQVSPMQARPSAQPPPQYSPSKAGAMHRVVLLVVGADVPQTSPAPHVPKKHGCPRFEIGWHFFESVFASLQARPSDSKQPTGARVATNQNSQPFALQLASQESPARPCENAAHTP